MTSRLSRIVLSFMLTIAYAYASDLQSAQAGAQPLIERMNILQSEISVLRQQLVDLTKSSAERERLLKRIEVLELERKQLDGEVQAIKQQANSPFVNYVSPARSDSEVSDK